MNKIIIINSGAPTGKKTGKSSFLFVIENNLTIIHLNFKQKL